MDKNRGYKDFKCPACKTEITYCPCCGVHYQLSKNENIKQINVCFECNHWNDCFEKFSDGKYFTCRIQKRIIKG